MRTIPLICALLLLTSCHKPQVGPLADDSPIIISDGSTAIQNPNFTQKQPQDAEITTVTHVAKALGFVCDPSSPTSPNSCATAPQCTQGGPTNTTRCRVDNLDSHPQWDLALCEGTASCSGNGDARVQWSNTGSLKVKIHTDKGNFTYPNPDLLVHGTAALQSAKLALHGGGNPTYDFSGCPPKATGQPCLIVLY
jgi:hypothetical protein